MVTQVHYTDLLPLRQKVLRSNQLIADCIFDGDQFALSAHFAFIKENSCLSIASIYPQNERNEMDLNTWRIRGMATDSKYRGNGYGGKLLHACMDYAKLQGGNYIWCNARFAASEFYLKFGFSSLGKPFTIQGIGSHIRMMYDLGEFD